MLLNVFRSYKSVELQLRESPKFSGPIQAAAASRIDLPV